MYNVSADTPAPAWLLRDEAYAPRPDREAFIDGSIRSLLGLLAALRRRDGRGAPTRSGAWVLGQGAPARAGLAGIDARVGLVSTLLFVLFVSLSRGNLFLACAATALLVILSLQRAEVLRDVLKTALAAGGFTLAVLLPSALTGNAFNAARLVVKVVACAACVRLYARLTEARRVTRALAAFRVPDVFILVLDTTLRSRMNTSGTRKAASARMCSSWSWTPPSGPSRCWVTSPCPSSRPCGCGPWEGILTRHACSRGSRGPFS
jgi:cobalt/nickel transport system permease protein